MKYIVLLRGINVGGNNIIRMVELKTCLEKAGFASVKTYIQSGNVLLTADRTGKARIIDRIETAIKNTFGLSVFVTVLTSEELERIVREAPSWWGKDEAWKHNLLVFLPGYKPDQAIGAIGPFKPDIERVAPAVGGVYQSLLFRKFGQTTTGKIASMPIYKFMTIRNYNTIQKLYSLLSAD